MSAEEIVDVYEFDVEQITQLVLASLKAQGVRFPEDQRMRIEGIWDDEGLPHMRAVFYRKAKSQNAKSSKAIH